MRFGNQQRRDAVVAGPDGLRDRINVSFMDMSLLDALFYCLTQMIVSSHAHRIRSHVMVRAESEIRMVDERYAVMIRVFQSELNVCPASFFQRLDRVIILPAYGFQFFGELGESLLAYGDEQLGFVFKIQVNCR